MEKNSWIRKQNNADPHPDDEQDNDFAKLLDFMNIRGAGKFKRYAHISTRGTDRKMLNNTV